MIHSSVSTRGSAIARAVSTARNEDAAVAELARELSPGQDDLTILFTSSRYDLGSLARNLQRQFGKAPVIGCTTAGEITPNGYSDGSISGFTLPAREFTSLVTLIPDLDRIDIAELGEVSESIRRRIAEASKGDPELHAFGLLLIDGLSVKEEEVVAHLYNALGDIPIVGGSAGDDMCFERTHILHDGAFLSNAAVLTVCLTNLPTRTFKTQHFEPTKQKLVITESDPKTRTVFEINGLPAARAYADLVGCSLDDLGPSVFSAHPVMLRIGGEQFVRSIQRRNPDNSLTFYCAIDTGLVLTMGQGVDLVRNLNQALEKATQEIPDPQLIITCECVLRRLEVLEKDLTEDVGAILSSHRAIGFHSYGEQFNSIHVNQTFSGIVIGRSQ